MTITFLFLGGKEMKQLLFLLMVLWGIRAQGHELPEQKIFRRMVSNHTRALDNKNMYDQPLDKNALQEWNDALMQIQYFVDSNSRKEKKYLRRCFSDIRKANAGLINKIEKVYNQCHGGTCDPEVRKKCGQKFEAIAHKMRLIQKSLDWVASRRAKENQAIRFVQVAAVFVGATARKAALNLT